MSSVADEPFAAPAAQPVPSAPQPRRWARRLLLVLLLLAGLAGLGGGGAALAAELTRHPTKAEVVAAGQAEVASRWQRLPAGRIFPATIRYLSTNGAAVVAARVGIAPPASCRAALDRAVFSLVRRRGCLTVLRASYLDGSGTVAAAIGVVVMSSPAAAQKAQGALPSDAGIRMPSFPGTRIALAGNAQRVFAQATLAAGPYLLFTVAGATDGRPGADLITGAPLDMTSGIGGRVQAVLTGGPAPCSRKDIRC